MPRTGRPSKITSSIERRQPDGTTQTLTVGEAIEADCRTLGMRAERAAARAGINKDTFHEWEKVAGRAREALARGDRVDAHARRCLDFSDRIFAAEVDWQARMEAAAEQLARGGVLQETTTNVVKVNEAGEEVERSTRTQTAHTLPDGQMIRWRLERRLPAEFREHVLVEGAGEGGAIPVEVRAAALGEALAAYQVAQARIRDEPPLPSPEPAPGPCELCGAPAGGPHGPPLHPDG